MACLANNHIGDFGEQPIFDTAEILKGLGITPFGAGKSITEARVLFEGKSEELSSLSRDIAELQSMKIPKRLVNGKSKVEN